LIWIDPPPTGALAWRPRREPKKAAAMVRQTLTTLFADIAVQNTAGAAPVALAFARRLLVQGDLRAPVRQPARRAMAS
jgi:hypothetical protein